MRLKLAILPLLALTFLARADEKLPMLKAGSQVYSNVTVTSVSATDVYFLYDKGAANVKLKDLDADSQKHFHYNAAAAAMATKANTPAKLTAFRPDPKRPRDAAGLKAEIADVMSAVRQIVNQPVQSFRQTPEMSVSIYKPGWFHAGATRPDFETVDIRKTQDLDYAKNEWVTSNLNPGIAFRGADVEFNSNTKFFYTDRTVPKKRLTEDEMKEINRLYRIIAVDEKDIEKLQP